MKFIPEKDWRAIVRYFRAEEKVLKDSYGIPGKKNRWHIQYRAAGEEAWELYEAARRAIAKAGRK